MKGRITRKYCYLDGKIVDMWYIQGIPFTFEEIPQPMAELDEVEHEAEDATGYDMQDMMRWSEYLIAEQCHPLLFTVEEFIENYEEVPE
jgi:hypothetical protein|tara:strand:+ start:3298 stop:3564 length:267 start_codon:yes stop_codon:yes gene_type:complete